MLQSKLFPFTQKETPKDEAAANAVLLTRGGFIQKLMSGVYSFLPLGFRVLKNIESVMREEMDAVGGQELLMPALHPKEIWAETGRFETVDDLYKFQDRQKKWLALGSTHEEIITDIVRRHVASYKNLPLYLYQIQTKFRDELRAKSGLLRGREFLMKDLYSFHADEEDRRAYYEKVKAAYSKIFHRCGLETLVAEASGGTFSNEYSHEFQAPTEAGEDLVVFCPAGDFTRNKEITDRRAGDDCPVCGKTLRDAKTIEVGNIFALGVKFSKSMGADFLDNKGEKRPIIMGCYGIGLGRVLGAVAEINRDEKGIIWPFEIAPFSAHLLAIGKEDAVFRRAEEIYRDLQKRGIKVLYDDRKSVSAGQKFADADLIGTPYRLVVSEKTGDKTEVQKRSGGEAALLNPAKLPEIIVP